MAGMANRFSMYSNTSSSPAPRSAAQQATQVSTTTLLNTLHTIYSSGQPYQLDAGTSLAVNTWLTTEQGGQGGTVDGDLTQRAWQHARRRAEDGCIVLCSLHESTPSLLSPYLASMPLSTPGIAYTALSALRPFVTNVTPANHAASRYSALAASYTFTLGGNVTALTLALSTSGLNVSDALLNIPAESGYRAFDVFYYLLTSSSTPAEREFLGLRDPSSYSFLNKSGTYNPPSYLPTADDAASAEDFRACLKAIGIKGASQRGLLSALAGLLKLGNSLGFLVDAEEVEDICEDVGGLLGVDPDVLLRGCNSNDREALVAGLYEALVDWVISKANEAIAREIQTSQENGSSDGTPGAGTPWADDQGDTVSITIVDVPDPALGKAIALRGVFDDSIGINAEMKEDGIDVVGAGHSVIKEMNNAVADVETDLGIPGGAAYRDREYENDKKQGVLEKVGVEVEDGGFLRTILYPSDGEGINLKKGRFDLPTTLGCSRVWYHLSLHPTDESPATIASLPSITSSWSAGTVSRQLRAWRLPEWANRRNKHLDFTADFDVDEFFTRYSRLGCKEGKDGAESWILERGWSNGDVVVGNERIWMREGAWWEAETMLDLIPEEQLSNPFNVMGASPFQSGYSATPPNPNGSGFFPPLADNMSIQDSRDNLLNQQSSATMTRSVGGAQSVAPSAAFNQMPGGDYGLGAKGDDRKDNVTYYDHGPGHYTGEIDPETGQPKRIESKPIPFNRRLWVGFVWALTFWIPSFLLRYVGRMKRPDVRLAWREKLVLTMLIFLLNGVIVFYIVAFGNIICPNKDKVWNVQELSYHQGDDDFYVSVRGKVYDISDFWTIQHSDKSIKVDEENMRPLAGQVLDAYFPPPLSRACGGFDIDDSIQLMNNNTDATTASPLAIHKSGPRANPEPDTKLNKLSWYDERFLPKMKGFYKGDLVHSTGNVSSMAEEDDRQWVIIKNRIYDLTDYFYTADTMNNLDDYNFLPGSVSDLIKENPGRDITNKWQDTVEFKNSLNCMDNVFYVGKTDFRDSAKCQVNNYILLAFAVVICTIVLIKFLAALQLGSKHRPSSQDKFVICQVPAYTEGEDQLRKGLDSLTALDYDNKRKLICVICDGMIVGGGNDRPTPKIVLDVLGVDPKIDPPALPFKSIGDGSAQLNYGKVYSGLYEYEGNVVPYIVVVKVGKDSEQSKSKPGNRGKRDSQILLLNFLNRVHYRVAMSPLELEMFHQINNIIGVDPELYEYVFMVDADTSVKEDSLTRLVASCSNDAKIAGICGETSLENEERSWWTMIQVYEYYISHHLVKAFESLFGSVTCLPGCFCMYRLRTADKGRPLIISDKVINEYADIDVDTLHKKNLLSLGEDRYLTTLMTKHFPAMSYKFIPDAFASTAAPETWSVLLSQRRRWINSTIHNLAELVFLKDLCGFCCFSMRFVVFVDLFGTIILPATCVYLAYLIYTVASGTGQFPLISIVMIACVYGLQAIIFIIKRQWQHIGWMIIYIIAFPIYSFVLPIYSFWNQDNFTWGNTRIVIGEKGDKRIVKVDDEGFDPRNIPLQRWDDYAYVNNLPGRRGNPGTGLEKPYQGGYTDDGGLEMDDIHSTYSSVKPASTILTGFPGQGQRGGPYMSPQSPAPFASSQPGNRNSHFSTLSRYTDQPQLGGHNSRHMSTANMSSYQDNPMAASRNSMLGMSSENMLGAPQRQSARSPLAGRPVSGAVDFRTGPGAGPDDASIVEAIQSCLSEVDLDSVTKKQVRALVEQRLQTELTGERKTFLDRQIDQELANMVYTASFAFFEALWEAGITYVFVNLGSDHPSILEAMVKGQKEKKDAFPTIITVPNEMVALSMADGYARLTGKPQCVIVHVDVGTQGLGAAVHNASCGRAPVLVFAGLSPYTIEGEMRGSRTEYIHWIQDVPDQKQIVGQYCRYAGEIKTGKNVKQVVNRALQFAKSDPMGPVYLLGAREAMEEELEPYKLDQNDWHSVSPSALSPDAIELVASHLVAAKEPLVITGYSGRWARSVAELVTLANTVKGLRVLDTGGSDMCFPADHPGALGLRFGKHDAITTADFILVLDCDVPWIPTQCKPSPSAKIIHIDVDPLKQQMPVFYIPTIATYRADSGVSLKQINQHIASNNELKQTLAGPQFSERQKKLEEAYKQKVQSLSELAATPEGGKDASFNVNYLVSQTRKACPTDTIWAVESVTLTLSVSDQIQATLPNSWINCGGGGLGWSGGGALGVKLASDTQNGGKGKGKFVCQIVGDGTYLFSVPGSVYWVSRRYNIPVLTIVLNNKGWNAPRNSMLLVHPDGDASRATNEDLNISFAPTPDYAGIAKAASGGTLWAGRAGTVEELARLLPQAIESVQNGTGAVLEAQLNGTEGKYTGK